jgi:hypothetical protein
VFGLIIGSFVTFYFSHPALFHELDFVHAHVSAAGRELSTEPWDSAEACPLGQVRVYLAALETPTVSTFRHQINERFHARHLHDMRAAQCVIAITTPSHCRSGIGF